MANEKPGQGGKKQALGLLQRNRLAEAMPILERLCAANRDDIEAWILLTKVSAQLGRPAKVEECCREIIRIDPHSHEAHFHLGSALLFQNKRSDATAAFQAALRLNPHHAATHVALAMLSDSLDAAFEHFSRAAQLDPSHVEAHNGTGSALVSFGQIEEAVARLQHCLKLRPGDHRIHSSMLFAMNYSSAYDAASVFGEHVRWGKVHSLPAASRHKNTPDPERRLRIGYVSPDLCEHSVAYFFEPLLANHDPARIETFCYADVAQADATTSRLQSLAANWRATHGTGDHELAQCIRADKIDILVDLAGHTSNNRLRVFSARPAPVQVSYLGYPNTTGLAAMDYRLTDEVADPPGQSDACHTETLVRLPHGFLCYRAPADAPPVAELPRSRRGHITFGSFNNLSKVAPEVVSLWAELLQQTPGSRLVLKHNALSSRYAQERYVKLFADKGIGPDRIELRGRDQTVTQHLGAYNDIDIALDTFPYHGTTTTCEALFMGVPVVTLAGQAHATRVGVSLLGRIGAEDLVAQTRQDYVRLASRLAQDPDELARRRAGLREQMSSSTLCDGRRFAQDVEAAYREMWKKWCRCR